MRPYENITTFEAMFDGYVDALDRFGVAAKTRDPKATYVPLFEALNWAVALDDRVDAHLVTGRRTRGRYGWRGYVPSAEIMAGSDSRGTASITSGPSSGPPPPPVSGRRRTAQALVA